MRNGERVLGQTAANQALDFILDITVYKRLRHKRVKRLHFRRISSKPLKEHITNS